jgi:pimeloyl-ACP methyl ester carboxylesterase
VIEGTPILLSGNMCDSRMWRPALRAALPGARPADLTRDDTIEAMAHRALASVEGPVVPVGFSMGGIVALAMARLAPGRIAGLVLLDTNPGADLPERAAARPAQQAVVAKGLLEQVIRQQLLPHYFAQDGATNPALPALVVQMGLALGRDVFIRQSQALRTRPDQRDVLPGLTAPVLLACGDQDRLCPPVWHQDMARQARRATLHVVPRAGHLMPLEQPRMLAAMIAAWCKQ